jgi:hypothetical protein
MQLVLLLLLLHLLLTDLPLPAQLCLQHQP